MLRDLGKTDLKVSALGFGAAPIGGHYGPLDDANAIAAIRHAVDRGINLIDTSPYYSETRSESVLGRALADGYRDRVILCTKAGRNGLTDFDFSPSAMLRSLERSLKRLRTDRVDGYFAHDIEFADDFEYVFVETYSALEKAKQQGKCRFIGMTGYPVCLLARAVERCRLDVVLSYCHNSLCNSRMLTELAPAAERTATGLINASALMMGLFSRKGPPSWHPASPTVRNHCARAVAHCLDHGVEPEVAALQFALRDARVATTLVGMCTVAEVDTNLKALDTQADEVFVAELLDILAPIQGAAWPSGNWPDESTLSA